MSTDTTTPTPAPDGTWNAEYTDAPDGVAEVCVDGHTVLTMQACGVENPSIEQACQQDAYRSQMDCTAFPKQSAVLPTTGPSETTAAIGGIGFVLVLIGAVLVRKVAVR